MLLVVNKVDSEKGLLTRLEESITKAYVWDTDDMTVEGLYSVDDLWSLIERGTIEIPNFRKVSFKWEKDSYYESRYMAFPFDTPVMLGCGDIWYGYYIWNAYSGCMFAILDWIIDISISETYYKIGFGTPSVLPPIKRYGTFLFKPTVGMRSYVEGDRGESISREDFMKRVTLGLLE